MPDFEALIRRQQDHQPAAAERLTLVPSPSPAPVAAPPLAWLVFAGSLMGALIGTFGFQWALAMGWWRF